VADGMQSEMAMRDDAAFVCIVDIAPVFVEYLLYQRMLQIKDTYLSLGKVI
jgi:hypothetical protein